MPREGAEKRKQRAKQIVRALLRAYPDVATALRFRNPFELLVATILSAQCTDAKVNQVTQELFAKYGSAEALAGAPAAEVERIVHPTGFYRQKARSIQSAACDLVEKFGGEVPARLEDLVRLRGVARKTANVVLGSWFRRAEGVVVDTHVGRLAHRLGLTWSSKNNKDAVKIEQDLCEVLPRKEWIYVGHALIWHGRRVCTARKPDCRFSAQQCQREKTRTPPSPKYDCGNIIHLFSSAGF